MRKEFSNFTVTDALKKSLGLMVAQASGHPDDFDTSMDNATISFHNRYKSNLTTTMRKVSNNCGYMLLACTWQGRTVDCKNFFETSKSDVGFCCSFNTVKLAQQS